MAATTNTGLIARTPQSERQLGDQRRDGVVASGVWFSIIGLGTAGGWESWAYLRFLFERLLNMVPEGLGSLLPYNGKPLSLIIHGRAFGWGIRCGGEFSRHVDALGDAVHFAFTQKLQGMSTQQQKGLVSRKYVPIAEERVRSVILFSSINLLANFRRGVDN